MPPEEGYFTELGRRFEKFERKLDEVSEEVRSVKQEMVGIDGHNGLKGQVKLLAESVETITKRNIAADTAKFVRGKLVAWMLGVISTVVGASLIYLLWGHK